MHNKTLFKYCFLVCVLFATACSEKPVTKQEAAVVAAVISDAMEHRKASKFNELIDMNSLQERIMDSTGHQLNETLVAGAMSSLRSGEFSQTVVKSLGKKGTYQFVKQYEKDNIQHLVFRSYNDQFNYHDIELFRKGDKIKIADIYIYATGENLSNTLAQSLLSMNKQVNKKDFEPRDVQKVQLIKNYILQNEHQKADELFKQLPSFIRRQKLYKYIYIQIASGLGTEKYLEALTKFQQEYPDSPNMYLLMLDAYFLKQDYAGAMQCINKLDSLIDKDPFLDYYRALIYKQSKDRPNTFASLERLHKNMPEFTDGTVELICYYAEEKQFDKAVPLTKQYIKSKNADEDVTNGLYIMYPGLKMQMEAAN
jgi:hypothetical protein